MREPMSDLEITKACAIAMGWQHLGAVGLDKMPADGKGLWCLSGANDWWIDPEGHHVCGPCEGLPPDYLNDDAQAMALVKRFGLWMSKHAGEENWRVAATLRDHVQNHTADPDLNRAICLCIAAMTATKD